MRKISLPENEYRSAKRANERIDSVRVDIDRLHRDIWKIKNKIKKQKGRKNKKIIKK